MPVFVSSSDFINFLIQDIDHEVPSPVTDAAKSDIFHTLVQVHPADENTVLFEFIEQAKSLAQRVKNIPATRTPGHSTHEIGNREDFELLVVTSDKNFFNNATNQPNMKVISKTIEEFLKDCVKNDRGIYFAEQGSILLIEPDRLFDYVRATWPEYLVELAEQGYSHCENSQLSAETETKIKSQLSMQSWVDSYTIRRMRFEGREMTLISIEGKQGISKEDVEEKSQFLAFTLGNIEPTIAIASTAWVPRISREINSN
ncbi:MAG: hypothetical protein U0R17_04490 [Acidimicrobiia bacterium]